MALPDAPMITAAAAANPEKMTQIPRITVALLQRALTKGNDATSTLKGVHNIMITTHDRSVVLSIFFGESCWIYFSEFAGYDF